PPLNCRCWTACRCQPITASVRGVHPAQGSRPRARRGQRCGGGARRSAVGRQQRTWWAADELHPAGVTRVQGARVLVVDDAPAILRAVQASLSRQDFRVDTASSGREALAAYTRLHPDVPLLALGLPDIDGLEAIRAI